MTSAAKAARLGLARLSLSFVLSGDAGNFRLTTYRSPLVPRPSSVICPTCHSETTGPFCSSCGAPVDGAACAGCGAALTPGAKFCHRCGLAAGARVRREGGAQSLPWAVAGIALLALVAMVASRNFSAARGGALDAPRNAVPQPELDERGSGSRAPDISALSPRERSDRLFDRVMRLASEGKADSVRLFGPMAIAAYEMTGALDNDQRYDLGRIAEVSGDASLAAAQADTILRGTPTHLLGLVLAARAADMRGDARARVAFERRLLAAERAEMASPRTEYERHRADIVAAISRAKSKVTGR